MKSYILLSTMTVTPFGKKTCKTQKEIEKREIKTFRNGNEHWDLKGIYLFTISLTLEKEVRSLLKLSQCF